MSEHRYEGTWKIPNIDNEQEGILFIDKNRGLIRLKLFVMGMMALASDIELKQYVQ